MENGLNEASNGTEAYTRGNYQFKSYGKLRNIQIRITLIEKKLDKILYLLENKEKILTGKEYLDQMFPKTPNDGSTNNNG